MSDTICQMLLRSLVVFQGNDTELIKEIKRDDVESGRGMEIITLIINLEHIGETIDKNLIDLAAKIIRKRVNFADRD